MTKRYQKNVTLVDQNKQYSLDEALEILAQMTGAKFDETVDLAVLLGVDPKQADQNIRGMVALPNGTGKKIRVAAFVKGDKAKEAEEAGADFVGDKELVDKIQGGFTDFDATVATPDMMGEVGKLGKVLGPRGLMPNPKLGTVTMDIGKAIKDLKGGKVEYRLDKTGIVHSMVGKKSFSKEKLKGNIEALMEALIKAKPASAKGVYLRSVTLSSTMSPGIKIDTAPYMKS